MPADRDDSCDNDGYRPNVAIVLVNRERKVLWARRADNGGWQFPQGGVHDGETLQQAALREMFEEVGLRPAQVRLIGRTRGWLRYEFPPERRQSHRQAGARGQKQAWFLFALLADDCEVCLDRSPAPEFDAWRWVEYWRPLREITAFKRAVYREALQQLHPMVKICNEQGAG